MIARTLWSLRTTLPGLDVPIFIRYISIRDLVILAGRFLIQKTCMTFVGCIQKDIIKYEQYLSQPKSRSVHYYLNIVNNMLDYLFTVQYIFSSVVVFCQQTCLTVIYFVQIWSDLGQELISGKRSSQPEFFHLSMVVEAINIQNSYRHHKIKENDIVGSQSKKWFCMLTTDAQDVF